MDGIPSGVGNQVSADFNLAYRWHSCISDKSTNGAKVCTRILLAKMRRILPQREMGAWRAEGSSKAAVRRSEKGGEQQIF